METPEPTAGADEWRRYSAHLRDLLAQAEQRQEEADARYAQGKKMSGRVRNTLNRVAQLLRDGDAAAAAALIERQQAIRRWRHASWNVP